MAFLAAQTSLADSSDLSHQEGISTHRTAPYWDPPHTHYTVYENAKTAAGFDQLIWHQQLCHGKNHGFFSFFLSFYL